MPREGGVYVVYSRAEQDYVRQMVADLLPEHFTGRLRIVVVSGSHDLPGLYGLRARVEIDHAAVERLPAATLEELEIIQASIHATLPPATGPSGVGTTTGSTGGTQETGSTGGEEVDGPTGVDH